MLPSFHSTLPRETENAIVSHLRWWAHLSGFFIVFGFFSFIFVYKFGISNNLIELAVNLPFSSEVSAKLGDIYRDRLHEILLFGFTVLWYVLYRTATLTEIDLIGKFDSVARMPRSPAEFLGARKVGPLALGITATFVLLASLVDRFHLYCALVFVLNVLDLQGNRLMMTNVRAHLAKPEYVPPDSDPEKPYIMRLREIARDYWVERPHLERIGRLMILNVVALLVYFFGEKALAETILFFSNVAPPGPSPWFSWPQITPIIALAYTVEIVAIGWNEYDLSRWRGERNLALKVVFGEQSAERTKRASGETASTMTKPRRKRPPRSSTPVKTSRAPSRPR